MKSSFFRTQKIDWPKEYAQQQAVIDNLSRRLESAESLLAATANLVRALSAKSEIHLGHTMEVGGVKPYITKDQPQMDNTTVAAQWVEEFLGRH